MFYGDRVKRGLGASIALAFALVLLTGCGSDNRTTLSATESAQASRKFETRSEAAAVAQRTYLKYLKASSAVWASSGRDTAPLRPFATEAEVAREGKSLRLLAKTGTRLSGSVALKRFQLQVVNVRTGTASAYACVDLSQARVLDKRGNDITPAERRSEQTNLLRFQFESGSLRVKETAPWSGRSIC